MRRICLIVRIDRLVAMDKPIEVRLRTEVKKKAYFEVG
jgi:hypothetical protein